jgi:hypothetical protein
MLPSAGELRAWANAAGQASGVSSRTAAVTRAFPDRMMQDPLLSQERP